MSHRDVKQRLGLLYGAGCSLLSKTEELFLGDCFVVNLVFDVNVNTHKILTKNLSFAFSNLGHSKRFTTLVTHYILAFTHSYTYSHTDGGVDHAGRQPARREQSG